MLIKTVFPVEELAGTLGMGASPAEATFYKRNGIQCARQYVQPVQPNSAQQLTQRYYLSTAAQYWSATLTDAQRLTWAAYSAAHPSIIKGQSVDIGGLAMFAMFAMHELQFGDTITPDAPSGSPAPDPNTYSLTSVALYAAGSPDITAVVGGLPTIGSGKYITCEYTPVLAGARNPRETDYRYIRDGAAVKKVITSGGTSASYTDSSHQILVTTGDRMGIRIRLWIAGIPTPIGSWASVVVATDHP